MTLIGETMTGRIIEVGDRGDGCEFVVEVEGGARPLHIPCTAPVAREAAAALYVPMQITFTMIARPDAGAPPASEKESGR